MSLLWKRCSKKKLITIHKRPSPTGYKHIYDFAQSIIIPKIEHFIKGISMCISCDKGVCGSMTVEAAVCLPLFLFFFLNIGSTVEIIRLHGNLQLALWEVGNRMAVYGHVLQEASPSEEAMIEAAAGDDEDSWGMELAGIAMSYTYVKAQILDYLGEEYLEQAPLSYGAAGLQFLESSIWETDGRFELLVTYEVSPLTDMAGFRSFRMANRYYGHLWNGYRISGTAEQGVEQQYVYITDTGQVYHTDRECTHLKLSVRQVGLSEACAATNANGRRYVSCEKCARGGSRERVYITSEGDCYHFEKECPGLKRTIYTVPLNDVGDRRLCMRCGAG